MAPKAGIRKDCPWFYPCEILMWTKTIVKHRKETACRRPWPILCGRQRCIRWDLPWQNHFLPLFISDKRGYLCHLLNWSIPRLFCVVHVNNALFAASKCTRNSTEYSSGTELVFVNRFPSCCCCFSKCLLFFEMLCRIIAPHEFSFNSGKRMKTKVCLT